MTLDELATKMDARFDRMDGKLDTLTTTVAVHTNTLNVHDRENKDIKERVSRLEKIIWVSLGGAGAAGFGIAKLFFPG